jgi:hypothetical protein
MNAFITAAQNALSPQVTERLAFAPTGFRTWEDVALLNEATTCLIEAGFAVEDIRDADAGIEWTLVIGDCDLIVRCHATKTGWSTELEIVKHQETPAARAAFDATLNAWAKQDMTRDGGEAYGPEVDRPGRQWFSRRAMCAKIADARKRTQRRPARSGLFC